MVLQPSKVTEPSRHSAATTSEAALLGRTVSTLLLLFSLIHWSLVKLPIIINHSLILSVNSVILPATISAVQFLQNGVLQSLSTCIFYPSISYNINVFRNWFIWLIIMCKCMGNSAVPFLEIDWRVQSQKRLETSALL